jgi:type VI secretion system (T6SS) baseplate-like injector VgrG
MSLMELLGDSRSAAPREYFGKYRGTVLNNIDPLGVGRIQAVVPDVSTTAITTWAMPCLPWGGMQTGLFTVPPVGSGVWIEFESGDPDYPIWTGCFWGSRAEVPSTAQVIPPTIPGVTLQTPMQTVLQVSDVPGPTGGIQLRTATGAMIQITDTGIVISNGKGAAITLLGNMVNINNGALTIT